MKTILIKRLCFLVLCSIFLFACGNQVKKTKENPIEEKSPMEMTPLEYKEYIQKNQRIDGASVVPLDVKNSKNYIQNITPKWIMSVVQKPKNTGNRDPKLMSILEEYYKADSIHHYLTKEERKSLGEYLNDLK